ncbi:MAG: hypothetical protein ACI4J6_12315 [Oscillospiraceae bacterium]
MNSKAKSSLIAAVLALVVLIAAIVSLCKITALPDSCKTVEKLIKGCEAQSERQISTCLSSSAYFGGFSSCVTVEDYLSACGISFDFMKDESCRLKEVKLVGSAEITDSDTIEKISSYTNKDVSYIFIAAEYTDSEGAEKNAVQSYYVISDSIDGKLVNISSSLYL